MFYYTFLQIAKRRIFLQSWNTVLLIWGSNYEKPLGSNYGHFWSLFFLGDTKCGLMSKSSLSPAVPIRGRKPQQTLPVWYPRKGESRKGGLRLDAATIHWAGRRNLFLVGRPSEWAENCAPPSHLKPLQHMVWCCHAIGATMLRLRIVHNISSISSLLLMVQMEPPQAVWYPHAL